MKNAFVLFVMDCFRILYINVRVKILLVVIHACFSSNELKIEFLQLQDLNIAIIKEDERLIDKSVTK